MILEAVTKNIQDILSAQKKYIIPRYQREYSWEREELTQLWEDIWAAIEYKDSKFTVGEYFIGSIVLSGSEQGEELEVVDGQQRLTTLSILLSALRATFEKNGMSKIADGAYAYIEGQDKDGEDFFKVVNPVVQPYFNECILYKKPKSTLPKNSEEKRLKYAYDFFIGKLKESEIEKIFKGKGVEYSQLLKAVRDQLLGFKLIYITVSEKKYANTIFETLNAKGKELTPVDLIKNEIFSIMDSDHPSDEARNKWASIKDALNSRSTGTSVPDYFRYYWLSKYKYIAQNKIYSEFIQKLTKSELDAEEYLNDVNRSVDFYVKMYSPKVEDWPGLENKYIYEMFKSLNTFKVKSPRIFLMALFDSRLISAKEKKSILLFLENFHFGFTAITSSKASGIDRKYSKYAILIRESFNKEDTRKILKDMKNDLVRMMPSKEVFMDGFNDLFFYKKKDKHKAVIKYSLIKYERSLLGNQELDVSNMSIEHISDESLNVEGRGKLGNLIPMSQEVNSKISDLKELNEKMKFYKKSNFMSVKEFCENYSEVDRLTSKDIDERTDYISERLYAVMMKEIDQ